jgi:hypothetical protein
MRDPSTEYIRTEDKAGADARADRAEREGAGKARERVPRAEDGEGGAAGALDVVRAPALRAHERLGLLLAALLGRAHPLQETVLVRDERASARVHPRLPRRRRLVLLFAADVAQFDPQVVDRGRDVRHGVGRGGIGRRDSSTATSRRGHAEVPRSALLRSSHPSLTQKTLLKPI